MQSWSSRSYLQICATVTMHLAVSVAVHVFSSLVYTTCSEGAISTPVQGKGLRGVSTSRRGCECCGECSGQQCVSVEPSVSVLRAYKHAPCLPGICPACDQVRAWLGVTLCLHVPTPVGYGPCANQ